jgi:hypothetical protein
MMVSAMSDECLIVFASVRSKYLACLKVGLYLVQFWRHFDCRNDVEEEAFHM